MVYPKALQNLFLVGIFWCATGQSTETDSCSAESSRIKILETTVTSLQNELELMKAECSEGQRISLTKLGSQCVSLSKGVLQHVLKSTDLDEQILHHVSTSAVAARDRALSLKNIIIDKVSGVNYTEHYHAVQSSGAFQSVMKQTESIQPFVDKAVDKARPILNNAKDACQPLIRKVEPMLANAKIVCKPVVDAALEKCSIALAAVE